MSYRSRPAWAWAQRWLPGARGASACWSLLVFGRHIFVFRSAAAIPICSKDKRWAIFSIELGFCICICALSCVWRATLCVYVLCAGLFYALRVRLVPRTRSRSASTHLVSSIGAPGLGEGAALFYLSSIKDIYTRTRLQKLCGNGLKKTLHGLCSWLACSMYSTPATSTSTLTAGLSASVHPFPSSSAPPSSAPPQPLPLPTATRA